MNSSDIPKPDYKEFKTKFLKLVKHITSKKVALEHGTKVDLTIFCFHTYKEEIESEILKLWNDHTFWNDLKTGNQKPKKIQSSSIFKQLKNEGIDCNEFGIEFKFDTKIEEPDFIPKKSEKKLNTKVLQQNQNESTPLILRVENYINSKYELRLDEVRNVLEVKLIGSDDLFNKDERFEANITVELLRNGFNGINSIVKALLGSDFVKKYHPIKEFLSNLEKWDKIDRIKQLAECLEVTSEHKTSIHNHLKKHLVRCVASVFIPNYFNKHCFVIVGTRQSMYKTSFIRFLCPDVLRQKYSTDAVLEWKDKDANIALGSNWIINLDELANLNRDETNSLKATLSRDWIKIRRPYDRVESEIPRLANFFGSTNDLQFLTDLTGNVRWICFRINGIDANYRQIDINQVWSQVMHEFKNDFDYQLTREEIKENEERNQNFMLTSPELEAIQIHIVPGMKDISIKELGGLPKFLRSSELFNYIKNVSGTNLRSLKIFGQALQSAGFISVSERDKITKQPIKGYWFHEVRPI